jgi:serine/threonine protein kinase
VKLFDFGLARLSADSSTQLLRKLTAAGMKVGTNEYMSPEQMLSPGDADHSADLWAVAVVAYLLLVASFPFRATRVADLFSLVAKRDFERPSAVREDVSPAVDAWFERAFHPRSQDRFASARELAAGFASALIEQARIPQAPAVPMPVPVAVAPVATTSTPQPVWSPAAPATMPVPIAAATAELDPTAGEPSTKLWPVIALIVVIAVAALAIRWLI